MTKLKDLKTCFMEDSEFRKGYAQAAGEYAPVETARRRRSPRCAATPKQRRRKADGGS